MNKYVWGGCRFFLLKVSASFIIISILLSGCTTSVPFRLTPAAVESAGEVKTVVFIEAENISIEILQSGYGSGLGLVGAIIDSGVEAKRKSDAEKLVIPLIENTKDMNYREEFISALSPVLKELSWPQVVEVDVKAKSVPVDISQTRDRSLLIIHLTYKLSATSEVLKMQTGYSFFLKGNTKAAVQGGTYCSSKRIGTGEENEDAIALWSADGAAAYREAVSLGIEETVKMLGLALPYIGHKSPPPPPENAVKMDVRLRHGRGDFGIKQSGSRLSGWILERNEDRVLFQSDQGRFYSFPASDLLKKHTS